jgi:hypothetical protein
MASALVVLPVCGASLSSWLLSPRIVIAVNRNQTAATPCNDGPQPPTFPPLPSLMADCCIVVVVASRMDIKRDNNDATIASRRTRGSTCCCRQCLPQLPSGGSKGRDVWRRTSIVFIAAMVPLFPPLLTLLFPPLRPPLCILPSLFPLLFPPILPPILPPLCPPRRQPLLPLLLSPPLVPPRLLPPPLLPSCPPLSSPPGARETMLKSMGGCLLGLFCQGGWSGRSFLVYCCIVL